MEKLYSVSIITVSDKCSRNEREDRSGKYLLDFFKEKDWEIVNYIIIPDEFDLILNTIKDICDKKSSDLIITTGGTGFSPRDVTPEAARAAIEREAPGISEYLRAQSQKLTSRAMLSRGVSGIRKKTLIINFPGSIKAVKESVEIIYKPILHGIDILISRDSECGGD